MKRIIFLMLLMVFFQNKTNAQNPINVIITGDCAEVSGTYIYNGLVNGKNNYTKTFDIEGESVVIGVGFDAVKWVLYAYGDLSDHGFINNAVPTGLLPPLTGWVNTACEDGTMVIEAALSTDDFEINNQNISIFPNPANNFITFQNKQNTTDDFDYKIFDLTGRIVKFGNARFLEQINIENLLSSHYIIQVETEKGEKLTKKLIKN